MFCKCMHLLPGDQRERESSAMQPSLNVTSVIKHFQLKCYQCDQTFSDGANLEKHRRGKQIIETQNLPIFSIECTFSQGIRERERESSAMQPSFNVTSVIKNFQLLPKAQD